jgi:hypothetical protein
MGSAVVIGDGAHVTVGSASAKEPYETTAANVKDTRREAEQIFISYRRADSPSAVGRIRDALVATYGRENVLFDIDTLPLGVDFRVHLKSLVARCAYMVVVIGPGWLHASDALGRRLDRADDWVRVEIETALQRQIPVVPVLVNGSSLPAAEDLPESLRDLVDRNATTVRNDPDFHTDITRLVAGLRRARLANGT